MCACEGKPYSLKRIFSQYWERRGDPIGGEKKGKEERERKEEGRGEKKKEREERREKTSFVKQQLVDMLHLQFLTKA